MRIIRDMCRSGRFLVPILCCLITLAAGACADEPPETLWDALVAAGASQSPGTVVPATGEALGDTPGRDARAALQRRWPFRALTDAQQWLQQLGKSTRSEIRVTGQHSLRYHMENISGSRDSYENSTYYGRRGMGGYTDTDVTISGKLFGLVSFETRYTDSLYGMPYDNRFKLSYATKEFTLEAGDIQAGITGNSLLDFNRSLKGFTLSTSVLKGIKLSALMTEERAQTRTIVINGANRSGPYYVFAGQVVDGSARVRVNNREMVLGQDYTLDPYTGELNFLNGLIVHELDTIAVTFETYGYNQSPGTLTGWRGEVTSFKPLRFGVTYLNQASRQGGPLRTRTDQFYGYNSTTTPYVLDWPVEVNLIRDAEGKIIGCTPVYPMTVTVSGIPQAYGTDYVLDPLLPNRVYFKMAIPSTQIIKITYTPASTDTSGGDRTVMGLDFNTPLGKMGTLTAEYARSALSLRSNSVSSDAWQIRSDMKLAGDRLRLNWTLKNIGTNFTAVQSPGFRRNDRGLTLSADYQANDRLKLNASFERSRRPAYSYTTGFGSSGLAPTAGLDSFNLASFRVNWQLGKNGTLSLTHNDMRTNLATGGNSTHLTDTLSLQQTFGQLGLDLSLGRQNASTTARSYTTGQQGEALFVSYGTDAFNARAAARWRLGERLSFDATFNNSSMRTREGKSNTAQDISLSTRAVPLKNMTVTLSYQYQTSGGYSLFSGYLGGTSGSGFVDGIQTRQVGTIGYPMGGLTGYYGGGVNSGLGGYGNYSGGFGSGLYGLGAASFGGNSKGLTLGINYQPWPTLSLDMNWMSSSSVGDFLYNSKRSGLSFNATYNPGQRLSLFGGAMFQNVSYIGSSGGTTTSTVYLNAQARPLGKLITMASVNFMRSSTKVDPRDTGGTTGGSTGGTGQDFFGGYYGSGYGAYFGSGSTNLSSYGFRMEYPVWLSGNLFLQWDNADSTGFLASTQRTLSFGLVFDLGNNTQLQIGWRDQRFRSKTNTAGSDYSYHVRSLDADLGIRF